MMFQGRTAARLAAIALLGFAIQAGAADFEAVPGEYVVTLRPAIQSLSTQQLAQTLNVEVIRKVSDASGAILVKRNILEKADYGVQSLSSNPMVEIAEPNYIYTINRLPNDPDLSKLWGILNTGQKSSGDAGVVQGVAGVDVGAEQAWDIQTGSRDIVVAVIDTGVDYTLPDLKNNMWVNQAEKNGKPGVDDDGNGFVDDIYGYDFGNKDSDPLDDHGHGSHVAGTIGAEGNDGRGIVGVNWQVSIMAIKFLTRSGGGTLDGAIASIDYATKMKAHMTNNSWGGGGFSRQLEDSIKRAKDAGILFVAAAGNDGKNNDNSPTYPATFDVDNIISVAAVNAAGDLAGFSCYGKKTVHVGAPGVNIFSNTPGGMKSWSGTSMASPHVAGVAALLLANERNLTYKDIKERLMATAKPLSSLRGKTITGGMVNAYLAISNNTPAPDENDPFIWDKRAENISTSHPYQSNFKQTWTIEVAGASKVAAYFSRFQTEKGYDKVTFLDADGNILGVWSGNHDDSFSPVATGSKLTVIFESDKSATDYGFDITNVAYKM